MFPGMQTYREGKYRPERGHAHDRHVWCNAGALEVLNTQEYRRVLDRGDMAYTINFANGSAARIFDGHPLWVALRQVISSGYLVEVYPLNLFAKYIPWAGKAGDLEQFDAIKIKKTT